MTTLLLQGADTVIGGVAGAATSFVGGAITDLIAGSTAGGGSVRTSTGPRLGEMPGLTSTEGAPIPRLYGRARIGGQLIWATRFEEVANTSTSVDRGASQGGKSLGASGKSKTTLTTTYAYYANLAVGLCEGPVALVRRVWADGRELDLSGVTMRVYPGDEAQAPDPLIVAKEGADQVSAYRGLAYVVFERLAVADFGNRVPQFSFEVVRPLGSVAAALRSVCLIPGATEFGYDTLPVTRSLGLGASAPENVHQLQRPADVLASLDALQALCPRLERVSLVVAWFGDDLRAGACTIAPRVDLSAKITSGGEWSVAGLSRLAARETSRAGGVAAYGGSPSDGAVIRLIAELKARGLAVTLYPFVMMDVASGNGLPDPSSGVPDQPAYPWRGRITCDPAPGRPGSPDGTAAAAGQVAALFGQAVPGDFSVVSGQVAYAGPAEWSLRRFVLHCASLANAAGGVEAFVIASELVGLTRVRSAPGVYPAVSALRMLAADLHTLLGPGTKLTYGADWTEYGAHVLDGGHEVRFPLDPLWADPHIDAVGIDYYPPISDWRDGPDHLDLAEAASPYDVAYLRARLAGGEAFDWFYASEADRLAQTRTPITDGAYGKPWIFRAKDLVGWWSNGHVERVGGVEIGPTAWVAGGKPIWLTEAGIPAVDKGPNAPNVFPDPKSSENALPPFSDGGRDDLAQARALHALLSRFDPALPGHLPAMNPATTLYPGQMIDPARTSLWCWDARPFPAFPDFDLVWADGADWWSGHWLTGRAEGMALDQLVGAILADFGLEAGGTDGLDGFLDGYVVDRVMSARDALEPLARLFGFDAGAAAGGIIWRGRGGAVDLTLAPGDLVETDGAPTLSASRAQETDLPAAIELGFTDSDGDYARAAVGSRRLAGTSRRESAQDVAAVIWRGEAQRLADVMLQDTWAGRDTFDLSLSPRALAVLPGDVLALPGDPPNRLVRVTRIVDGAARRITAVSVEPAAFRVVAGPASDGRPRTPPAISGPPAAVLLDLPVSPVQPEPLQYLAVAADPWPGAVAVWRSAGDGAGFTLQTLIELPAVIGRTLGPFPPGPVWRWDRTTELELVLSGGALSTLDENAALAGGNLLAIAGPEGDWEIVSAQRADLIGDNTYRLSGFLRGLSGTEALSARTLAPGATAVFLDAAVTPLTSALADIGRPYTYRVGPAGRDPADPSFVELSGPVGTLALRPLSPVHVEARRGADGVRITWIRRTRIDGDPWEPADVPLGEEGEAYALDILRAGTVVRSFAVEGGPAVLYAAADELADFGAPQSALLIGVAQVSRVAGPGASELTTVPIL